MSKTSFLKSNKGASVVMFTIMLVVVAACTSLTVDVGLTVMNKALIHNAADAAVLAGGQELIRDRDNAENVAQAFLQKNGVQPEEGTVTISEDGSSITVSAKREVTYYFASIIGFKKGEVRAESTVRIMPVTSVHSGVRPFAVPDQVLNYGQRYTLKEGAGSAYSGNYGAMALGGTGSSNFKDNIIYGYQGSLKVGDYVDTETGNMKQSTISGVRTLVGTCDHYPKCTFESFEPDCPRIITVMVVNSLEVSGRKPIKIVGFASFFLEDAIDIGGDTKITGKFIKNSVDGEVSEVQVNYGLMSTKLIN